MMAAHTAIKCSGLPNYLGCWLTIPSYFNFEFLEHELKDYHDKLVIDFLKYGFPVDHDGTTGVSISLHNHAGAREFKDEVEKQ